MNTHFFSRQQHWLVLMFGCLLVFSPQALPMATGWIMHRGWRRSMSRLPLALDCW